jgi:4-hydroxy-3-polyprenylbenzoate decarboxylase
VSGSGGEAPGNISRDGLMSSDDHPGPQQCGLRAFIRLLSACGRLKRVQEPTHWRYEIGRRTRESRSPLLFENIVDYPGQRVFTNGQRDLSLIALALGMDPEIRRVDLNAELRRRIAAPITPTIVSGTFELRSACTGEDIDLLRLPVPHWNEQDGGRYLGTWHLNVTRDLQTRVRNVGVYRMQLLDRNHATVSTSPGSHLRQHLAIAEKEGQPLPMAVAIGVEEAVVMAAAAGCSVGTDEYDLAGALRQRPLDLVRCEQVDLEVPADAEIVIEGFVQPGQRVQDGPFLDYMGTTNSNPDAFLFEAKCVRCRTDTIFRGTSIGIPGAEDHQILTVLADLQLLDFHGSALKKNLQNLFLRQRLHQWIAE